MSHRIRVTRVACVCLALVLGLSTTVHAEVLGHISDDTETTFPSQTAEPSRDRQIIYRVICNPGDEQLPDCEQPVRDVEYVEGGKPAEDTTPSFPPDPEDAVSSEPQTQPVVTASQPKPRVGAEKAVKAKNKASDKSGKTAGRRPRNVKADPSKGGKKTAKSAKTGKSAKDTKPAKKAKK